MIFERMAAERGLTVSVDRNAEPPTVTVLAGSDWAVHDKPKPGGDAIDAKFFRRGRLQGLALSDLPTADLIRMWEKGAPS